MQIRSKKLDGKTYNLAKKYICIPFERGKSKIILFWVIEFISWSY